MTHPDNSILLAHIRKQPCGEWEERVQYHIDHCSSCRVDYLGLLSADALLTEVIALSVGHMYLPVADHVMSEIACSKSSFSERASRHMIDALVRPFARPKLINATILLALFCIFIMAVLVFANLIQHANSTNGSAPKVIHSVIVTQQIVPKIPAHTAPRLASTPTPVTYKPTVRVCGQTGDADHKHLR